MAHRTVVFILIAIQPRQVVVTRRSIKRDLLAQYLLNLQCIIIIAIRHIVERIVAVEIACGMVKEFGGL